jgi:predicted small lipoprotein YifL
MMKNLLLSFFFLTAFSLITGCGGEGGPAEFDPSTADAYTDADEQAAADYEAELKRQHEEQYGK